MSQTQDPMQQPAGQSASQDGPVQDPYWRSLDQLADPAEFKERHKNEFADGASEAPVFDDVSRRKFLGVVAASVAMASMTSCRKPETRILPFGKRPEDMVPGNPTYYATAHIAGGLGTGILVKSSDGRPTKVEGNPMHPSSQGATDQLMQAELLNLYDPARSHHNTDRDACSHDHENGDHSHDHGDHELLPQTMEQFSTYFAAQVKGLGGTGEGVHLLMEPTSSPSVAAAVTRMAAKYPKAQVHFWAPVNRDAANAASTTLFGKAMDTHYDLSKANVVVSVECDFQGQDGDALKNARDFASRRRATTPDEAAKIARLYAIESFHSVTGSNSDHRFRIRASEAGEVVMALAAELGKLGVKVDGDFSGYAGVASKHKFNGKDWLPILAKDLHENRGKSALVVGPRLPANVQVVLHAINHALGNVGNDRPVQYAATPAGLAVDCTKSLTALCKAIDAGSAKFLVMLGGNPAYNAPADLDFGGKLDKLAHTVHLSLFKNETGARCKWNLTQAHDLEAWGDILGHDGTASLVQPLIAPLYHGTSTLELIELMVSGSKDGQTGYNLIRNYWKTKASGSFETWWARALHDGVVSGTAAAAASATPNAAAVSAAVQSHKAAAPASMTNLEVQFRPSYNLHDGRYSNNSWLMELPDPMTKMTWDNAALISLTTLNALAVEQGDVVEFAVNGKKVEAPVWVLPGHADHSVTMTLGFGRTLGEDFHTANGAGYNAYSVRCAATADLATGGSAKPTGAHTRIAVTQEHGTMEGRAIVRENTVEGYAKNPNFAPDANPLAEVAKVHNIVHPDKPKLTAEDYNKSLWKESDLPAEFDYSKGYQWGMVIDLNACIGCNACVAACVSENNITTVGKEQVLAGREMHWNRVDRYFGNETQSNVKSDGIAPQFNAIPASDNPKVVHQMVPCMQCENASCEVVCPVAATSHSPEGLNDMAYNRCIGTRYCGNNCPYKVRHFNYLDYHGEVPETIKMARNPDVTIRSRGVMEKCTYCVQRINGAKIAAKRDGRRALRDGEIKMACEQSCSTDAITFGDINDKQSRVSKLKDSNLNYGLLAEFNMRPRTTYLAKIRNPNPELA